MTVIEDWLSRSGRGALRYLKAHISIHSHELCLGVPYEAMVSLPQHPLSQPLLGLLPVGCPLVDTLLWNNALQKDDHIET